tara:strand:- start:652 stop:855 length:204 start_codon:yes stop_codon:yes gene_type:complete
MGFTIQIMSIKQYKKVMHYGHKRKVSQVKRKSRFKNIFERDLSAMKQVWQMLKEGTVRWFGEVGRQY